MKEEKRIKQILIKWEHEVDAPNQGVAKVRLLDHAEINFRDGQVNPWCHLEYLTLILKNGIPIDNTYRPHRECMDLADIRAKLAQELNKISPIAKLQYEYVILDDNDQVIISRDIVEPDERTLVPLDSILDLILNSPIQQINS